MAVSEQVQKPRLEYMPLSGMKTAPRNPKLHNLDSIADSFMRFGFTLPLLINEKTGRMVAGHGRVEALQMMRDSGKPAPARIQVKSGEWLVPVVRGISFENEKEAEAYLLADNQTTIIGDYDEKLLSEILKDHADQLIGMGFTDREVAARIKDEFIDIPNPTMGFNIAIVVETEKARDKAVKVLKDAGYEPEVTAARL